MAPEFRALGVPRARRGADTDDVLDFLARAFADDVVERTASRSCSCRGPRGRAILVGGAPPHALARAARFGDGWMPIGQKPDRPRAARRARCASCSRPRASPRPRSP